MPSRRLITREEIQAAVDRMAADIDRDHPDGVLLVAVLKGSVLLLADLVRRVQVPSRVDFLALSRFAPDSGRVRILMDVDDKVAGADIVLVEDIVDTGLTSTFLIRHLESLGARSVRICTLLDRARRRIVPVEIDYRGFDLDDEFVLGYGLDFEERYRNLEDIVTGDLERLAADPDAHVGEWFPAPA